MKESELYSALRTEVHWHDFFTFVDQSPSIAQGGQHVREVRS
jgi:hypothetical protein